MAMPSWSHVSRNQAIDQAVNRSLPHLYASVLRYMDATDLLKRITVSPDVCHGKPCIRGLRYPVETMLELLSAGMTPEDLLADYPDLEPEDIRAVLLYAARLSQVKGMYTVAS